MNHLLCCKTARLTCNDALEAGIGDPANTSDEAHVYAARVHTVSATVKDAELLSHSRSTYTGQPRNVGPVNIAHTLVNAGKELDKALDIYTQILTAFPNHVEALKGRATIMLMQVRSS